MDKISVQIRFRKGIFTCSCGQEDVVDFNVAGGNTYENICSVCGEWSNTFKNYDGILAYAKDEYESLSASDISKAKEDKCDNWLYEVKHPPKYIEPSAEDLEKQKVELESQIEVLSGKINAKRLK
jgi:hypothetical protein